MASKTGRFVYELTRNDLKLKSLSVFVVNSLTCLRRPILSSEPDAPPKDLQLNDTTSTSILVTWNEVPAFNRNGIILSYTVRYQAVGEVSVNAPIYNKTVEFPTLQANLTGLIKNQKYNISVLATTSKGNGPYSSPIPITTNQDSKLAF